MHYDLHIHSNCSDGSDDWETILRKAEAAGLDCISVTDHESCDFYFQMDARQKLFTGKIITGIEMQAFFMGISIEMLGYGIDPEKMREAIKGLYMPQSEVFRIEMERLYARCVELGMDFAPHVLERYDKNKHFYTTQYLHEEMRKFPQNRRLVPDEASWERENIFFKRHTSNPNSPYYIDVSDLIPAAGSVIDTIRLAGGKVVIPHAYQYGENSDRILHGLLEAYPIDGIECFYPSFTPDQEQYLLGLCLEKNLLVSGGSDYHGASRPELKIGMMKGRAHGETKSVVECIG